MKYTQSTVGSVVRTTTRKVLYEDEAHIVNSKHARQESILTFVNELMVTYTFL